MSAKEFQIIYDKALTIAKKEYSKKKRSLFQRLFRK